MSESETVGAAEANQDDEREQLRFARICFIVLFLVGVVLTVSVPFNLPIGDVTHTQPGFWPFWVSMITTIFLAIAIVRTKLLLAGVERLTGDEFRHVVLAVPVLLLAVPTLMLFGIAITTALVAFYWFKVATKSAWLTSVIGAIAVAGSALIIFIYLLDVPFPSGELTGF